MTRKLLQKRRILPDEFSEALRTIGVYASFKSFKKWKPIVEAAYNRQSRRFKRKVRSDMLAMYASLKEWATALQFVSVRRPSNSSEMFFEMAVLLEFERLEEARLLAIRCANALSFANSRFENGLLLDALGSFFARTRRWDSAVKAWQLAPLDQPFRADALSGIAKIHLGRALESIEVGLCNLAELKENPDNENELCLPGNDLKLTLDAENELLKFKRGIEKLLPEDARKELGLTTESR